MEVTSMEYSTHSGVGDFYLMLPAFMIIFVFMMLYKVIEGLTKPEVLGTVAGAAARGGISGLLRG
jgi:hypothetical protein